MKFSATLILGALAAFASAQIQLTNSAFDVQEGKPFTITWSGAGEEGVTIKLKNGKSGDLDDVETLTTSGSGGSYTFTPEDLPTDEYAFEIIDNATGKNNYSVQFGYSGTGSAHTTAASATATATATGTKTKVSSVATYTATTVTKSSSSASAHHSSSSADVSSSASAPVSSSSASNASSSGEASTTLATVTSGTTASSTASETGSETTIPTTNSGKKFQSPLALVLVTAMALVYFN